MEMGLPQLVLKGQEEKERARLTTRVREREREPTTRESPNKNRDIGLKDTSP